MYNREIIDESDVYVDNEQTIKRKFSTTTPIVRASDLAPSGQNGKDPSAVATEPEFERPRRRSTGLSLKAGLASKRGRSKSPGGEHPKHLGPSNLASKPHTTRYSSTIKIKPGKGLDGDLLAETSGVRDVDEGTPLLGSK